MSSISKPNLVNLEERVAHLNEEIARLEMVKNDKIKEHELGFKLIESEKDKAQAGLDALNQNRTKTESQIKELEVRKEKLLAELEEYSSGLRELQKAHTEVLQKSTSMERDLAFRNQVLTQLQEKNKNTEIYLEGVNQDQVKREKGINARLAEISAREANLEAQNQAIIEKKSENEQVASKHTATTNELKNKELTLKQREQQLLSDQQEHQKQLRDLENLREEVTSRKREVENKEQVQSAMKDQLIERESQVQKKERDIQVRDKEYQIRLDEVTYRERVLKNKEKLLNTPEA